MSRKSKTRLLPRSASHRFVMAALCLTLALPAWSQDESGNMLQVLSRADANEDGDVTRAELVESRQNIFDRLDRNEDGVVNSRDRPPPLARRRFDQVFSQLSSEFDADGNGTLTHDEFVGGPTPGFDVGDIDGDDVLSAEEISNLRPDAAD